MSEPTPIVLSSPDAGNRSAGEMLRRAREAQGMTLEGLASTIKVTPNKLEALELSQYDRLPDANFTRALAMTVCRALKIDPTEVLAALPAAKPAALAEGKPPLNQPFKDVRGGSPLFERTADWSALLSFRWLAPLLLLLGAVVIYLLPESLDMPAWVTKWTHPAAHVAADAASEVAMVASQPEVMASGAIVTAEPASVPAPAEAAASAASMTSLVLDAADQAAVAGSAPVVRDPRLENQSAAIAPTPGQDGGAGSSSAAASNGSGPITLAVRDGSWIEVRDATGARLLSRHVQGGETLSLDGAAPFSLRIGNAPGVQLSYKGQPVDLTPLTRNNVARVELK